jgi:5-formyltetrahydrofolate cyclo-ligase
MVARHSGFLPLGFSQLGVFLPEIFMDIAEVKRKARSAAAKRRAGAHEALKDMAGLALARRGLPEGIGIATGIVSGFIPYKSEITTIPLMEALHRNGWQTCLPVVVAADEPLIFRVWNPGDALVPGMWDIPVPLERAAEVLPDVLLVPMLAFDRQGFRLGYGGGFYDRTLAKLRALKNALAIGVAYAAQVADDVPRDAYDAPLDYVMTEEETFRCG